MQNKDKFEGKKDKLFFYKRDVAIKMNIDETKV